VHLPTVLHLSLGFLTLGIKRLDEEMKKITGTTVADVMEKEAHTLSPDTPVEDVATMIVEEGLHYFPVIENEGVAGVVTRKDIVRAIAKGAL
jgi:CBS domain-containing protein